MKQKNYKSKRSGEQSWLWILRSKWYNSNNRLSNGRMQVVNEAHYIPKRSVLPKALHNTEFKKQCRKEMLKEKDRDECTYCWAVEDADPNA